MCFLKRDLGSYMHVFLGRQKCALGLATSAYPILERRLCHLLAGVLCLYPEPFDVHLGWLSFDRETREDGETKASINLGTRGQMP